MKKTIMVVLLAFVSVFAFAIPSGCYEGSSRSFRGRCAIQISGDVLNIVNREGTVIARWNIINDNDGRLTLQSSLGATTTATWWRENGKVYLNYNYETYTSMD